MGRRQAIVGVVGEDLVEPPLVSRVEPVLVGHDAGRSVDDLGGAHAAVKRFQLLEGIGLCPHLDRLPDHAVKVDQGAPAQQPINLLLARRIDAGQLLEGTRLVGGVVIHMQVGIAIEPLDKEVHHLLKGALLRLCVMRPKGMVTGPTLHHLSDPK